MELTTGVGRVAIGQQVDAGNQHAVRIEAGVDVLRRLQRAHEQRGADQQHETDRHLCDDQRAAQTLPRPSPAAAARFLLERVHRVGPRRLQRRREAEDDAGHDRDRGGIDERPAIDS